MGEDRQSNNQGKHGNDANIHKTTEVDRLAVTVVTDNYYDSLRPDTAISTTYRSKPGSVIHAEHGLSYHVETVADGVAASLFFDFGMDPMGMAHNTDVLGIDIGKISVLALSHGHFDHWGGLAGFLKQHGSHIPKGIPLYVGPEAFARRFSLRPSDEKPQDIGALDRTELEKLGIVEIIETKEAREIVPGGYLTGPIPRVTEYEKDNPNLLIRKKDLLVQDSFEGELAMVFAVKGRGLVILSGCAHVGIVNIIKHALAMTGISRVHAIIGGFHLVNARKDLIDRSIEDIRGFAPDYIVPTHCTGFETVMRFAREMPEQFVLNTAGTRYSFGVGER
ncbi:MAG: Metallo-beta-lactamase superfamily protein [Syntrophorhabdus sp. PtaU1.Bin002]|nr:MAG: Metallo-beta-lactamase superfamily protein [Syntrophorhabdus sp. PtaU1.Bin002]